MNTQRLGTVCSLYQILFQLPLAPFSPLPGETCPRGETSPAGPVKSPSGDYTAVQQPSLPGSNFSAAIAASTL